MTKPNQSENSNQRRLTLAQKIQAIAQSGLQYTGNPFDIERYHELSWIATEMMIEGTGADADRGRVVFDAQCGYATPKLDIRGVVFTVEELLLVRELADGGRWTLPGGRVDVSEPPSLAVEREVLEEAGTLVKARKKLALYDRNMHGHPPTLFHTYKIFVLCDLIWESMASALETSDPSFFSLAEIPELSLSRVTPKQIARIFEHLHDAKLPADFVSADFD